MLASGCVLHLCCTKSCTMFSKLLIYIKLYYHEVSLTNWCVWVCVCVFSLMTLVHYTGKIIFILLTNSSLLIIKFCYLYFFLSLCVVLIALPECFQVLYDIVWVDANQPTNQPCSTVLNQSRYLPHCITTKFRRSGHLSLS